MKGMMDILVTQLARMSAAGLLLIEIVVLAITFVDL